MTLVLWSACELTQPSGIEAVSFNIDNLLCFSFSFHHTRIKKKKKKIKGWLSKRQCNWFPHEDDPISPQWDFVLCVRVEWECQLPRSPGIGWGGLPASINQWPISPSQCSHSDWLTKSNDEQLNHRWEESDYKAEAQRSAPRESLNWGTYVTASAGGRHLLRFPFPPWSKES